MGGDGAFATWGDLIAVLWNEPFNRPIAEIKKLTLTQVCNLLRGRDKDGSLKVSVLPDTGNSAKDSMDVYLDAIGILDAGKRRQVRAKYGRREGSGAGVPAGETG